MPADLLATISAEIDARLAQLRLAIEEYEQLLSAVAALEDEGRKVAPAQEKASPGRKAPVRKATPAPVKPKRAAAPKRRSQKVAPARSARNEAQQAIVAALEHGSHTVAELTIVTAMSGPVIRDGLKGLQKAKKVTKAKREGKAAYALAG